MKFTVLMIGIPSEGEWDKVIGCGYLTGLKKLIQETSGWKAEGRGRMMAVPGETGQSSSYPDSVRKEALDLRHSLLGSQVERLNLLCREGCFKQQSLSALNSHSQTGVINSNCTCLAFGCKRPGLPAFGSG